MHIFPFKLLGDTVTTNDYKSKNEKSLIACFVSLLTLAGTEEQAGAWKRPLPHNPPGRYLCQVVCFILLAIK